MTIEQPAELNRIVFPPVAERRQRHYALLLPLLTYIAICGAMASLGADLKHGVLWNWPKALGLAVCVPTLLLVVFEFSLRASGGKRRLIVTESGLELHPYRKGRCLPWKAIRALEIEPLPSSSALFRLVVRHGPQNFGWLIGIQSVEQRQALLRRVSELETAGRIPHGLIVEFPRVPKRDVLGPAVSLWIGAFGLLVLTLGYPAAGSALSELMDEHKRVEHRTRIREETTKLIKKLRESGAPETDSAWWKALVREVVSGEQTLTQLGFTALLAIGGIGSVFLSLCCFVGQVLWNRQAQLAWRLDMQADLQRITP